ncbi:MAG: VanZ family protein [Bryobacterales bacterium]|nr:VanZ family protein [Bryobacterales bacterium]
MVVTGSLLPSSSSPMRAWSALHIADKLQHFTAYAVLAFLPTLHERRPVFAGIALGIIAMGVCLEFGQRLSEGRFFEMGDMVANTGGVLTGLILGLPSRNWIFARVRNSDPPRV